ncbi:hypothetical protein baBA2_000197 [Borrelia anserina]|uniref:HD-GYP domain-containing protein n=2 Tax=Borrelia anserina TaxID=143 RepID=W5SUW1_BORAN|nr:hypothetical protein [Borrelia anserina]AHH08166.1 Hypothetical protein BAN_0095000 [Borrelia anserina BA2]AHH08826.1 Hypothetical protein BAN_0095001 [Borrelia anserina BA2]APR64698.1 hypothetical protein N187_00980 [Borrelia anserina Es]UPA06613.1 hypothetical protein baBA2_000197 [Borrelia anserina]
MIFKEIKKVENLTEEDIIFSNIGNLAKLSTRVNEKIIKFLNKGNVSHIHVINNYNNIPHETLINTINKELLNNEINLLKDELKEALKDIYKPFSEKDKIFTIAGRKTIINLNTLMEKEPDPIYYKEIIEGSFKILPRHKIISIQKILLKIYDYFDFQKTINSDNFHNKKKIKKLYLHSIRRDYEFFRGQIKTEGDSILTHAIDTMIYFLITIAQLNKERAAKDAPRSTSKFFINKSNYTEFTEFFYDNDTILQAALGVLLHPIGLMHTTILQKLSEKISFKNKATKEKYFSKIDILEKSINISKNLFRMREDISAITKMIINGQKNYLNIKNSTELITKKFTHELVRIFCIIDAYDEMVNPIIIKEPVNPLEAIEFLKKNSEKYYWDKDKIEKYSKNKRFDSEMLKNFLKILAPFDYGTILNVCTKDCNEPLFKAVVLEYTTGILPILSIIKQNDKSYKIGDIILNLDSKETIIKGQNGNIKKNPIKNTDKLELRHNIEELKSDELQFLTSIQDE